MMTKEAGVDPGRGPSCARLRPVPFPQLVRRIAEEYRAAGSVFGIPRALFFHKTTGRRVSLFGERCDLPLGPAAGPHTQMAQNIVASYLAGGRFFELKTVQRLDALQIGKPCIDAAEEDGGAGEGYNTEWSTELRLEEAFAEYVKAWFLLHLLEEAFELGGPPPGSPPAGRSFLFDLSVGYDLEGIRSPRMDRFIDGMIDASAEPVFQSCREELRRLLREGAAGAAAGAAGGASRGVPWRRIDPQALLERVSPRICRSVTLSTMHGCPPQEIEAICRHLLEAKGLATLLKLNPTLLGYERVRRTLDGLGCGGVALAEESFARDLQYEEALRLLSGLLSRSRERGLFFGVKLTNTLEVINTRGVLPGKRMYLSGRPLFPLAAQAAARLAEAFAGALPISFCGGAAAGDVSRILATGIRPVTMVTDLLRPGGYRRLRAAAQRAEAAPGWERETVDVEGVRRLAAEAAAPGGRGGAGGSRRGAGLPTVDRALPLLDCGACRRCVDACPNRANLAVPVPPAADWTDRFQIVHLGEWCNECGNCVPFCPYVRGRPWRDKFTLFRGPEDLQGGPAAGFLVQGAEGRLRLGGVVRPLAVTGAGVVAPASRPPAGRRPPRGAGGGPSGGPSLEAVVRLINILWKDYPSLFGRGEGGRGEKP